MMTGTNAAERLLPPSAARMQLVAVDLMPALGVAQVIEHCHSKGILHRDLKPENFLLKERNGSIEKDNVRAVDFGLSTAHVSGQVCKKVVGSAYYLAPEVLKVLPSSPATPPPPPPPPHTPRTPVLFHESRTRIGARSCTRAMRSTVPGCAFARTYVRRIPVSLVLAYDVWNWLAASSLPTWDLLLVFKVLCLRSLETLRQA